jgi:dCMP deaminase
MISDLEFLRLAAIYGVSYSQDKSTQNGAVLVRNGDVLVMAANRFSPGSPVRHDRPEKYKVIEHAERGAIYAAARDGHRTLGARLYCPWFACPDCARAIVACGIREVVGSVVTVDATPERWRPLIRDGEAILRDGGVSIRWLAGRLGVPILFDGRVLEL